MTYIKKHWQTLWTSFPKIAFNHFSYLLEEWGVLSEVSGDHIETEKVAIDALSCHCQAVHVLVFLCCYFKQPEALLSLQIHTNGTICIPKQDSDIGAVFRAWGGCCQNLRLHFWPWHEQSHKPPQCRSAPFLYDPHGTSGSWRLRMSDRTSLCPAEK